MLRINRKYDPFYVFRNIFSTASGRWQSIHTGLTFEELNLPIEALDVGGVELTTRISNKKKLENKAKPGTNIPPLLTPCVKPESRHDANSVNTGSTALCQLAVQPVTTKLAWWRQLSVSDVFDTIQLWNGYARQRTLTSLISIKVYRLSAIILIQADLW